jgi:5-hydroxyisourate hydrolase-like protein (transthyretin family)
MSRLVSSTRARVLTVAVSSAAVALLGLVAVPTASAAPGGQISGTVTDAAGDPLAGITVTAYSSDTGEFGDEATTKKDGTYTLKKLDAAGYTVEYMDNSDSPLYATEYYDDRADFEDATPVTVAAGQQVSGIDAELARFGTISGRVTDEEGNPLGGIFVDVLEVTDDGPPFDSPGGTQTAADGTYRFPFAPAGSYVVGFTDLDGTYVNEYYDDHLSIFEADPVTVTAGGTTAAIDAELALGGHLSGTVTDSEGHGLGGIEIQLAREVGPDEWFGFGEEYGYHTEDDGTYQLDGLPAGTWRVGFADQEGDYLSEYYDDVTDFGEATEVDVVAGEETAGIDAELADAAHVTGTVTDEDGNPLEGIFVALRALEDGNWSYFGDAETAADGTYAMDGLRPGTNYRVSFESQGDWATEYWDDSVAIDDATPVDLTNGQTLPDIDAELASAAHITGEVTDGNGDPYGFVAVIAYRWTGSQWEDYNLAFTETFDDDTTNDAEYDVAGLVPGTYRLEFDAYDVIPQGLSWASHEFWNDQPSLELAQDVAVTSAGQVLEGYDAVLVRDQYPDEVQNLTPPTISGSPVVGQTLTASPGTWNLAATTYQYQWLAGTTPVGGNSPTYTPTAADVGKTISVVVTGAVAGIGSATAQSVATAPVTAPVTTTPPPPPPPAAKKVLLVKKPVIKGSLVVGTKARVTAGQWNPADVTLSYQWFVDGDRIAHAVNRKLMLKEKWVGERLTVKVVAKADGYLKSVVVTKRSPKIAAG